MKPEDIVPGTLYKHSSFPDTVYEGVKSPYRGAWPLLRIKVSPREPQSVGQLVHYDEDDSFWRMFSRKRESVIIAGHEVVKCKSGVQIGCTYVTWAKIEQVLDMRNENV